MGLLLADGILDSLRQRLSSGPAEQVRALAERVANGDDPAALPQMFPALAQLGFGSLLGPAFTRGFGLITLYGGVAALVMATASLGTFGASSRAHRSARRTRPPVPHR